jgi:hypothetical protein
LLDESNRHPVATDTDAKARFTDAAKRWRDAASRTKGDAFAVTPRDMILYSEGFSAALKTVVPQV